MSHSPSGQAQERGVAANRMFREAWWCDVWLGWLGEILRQHHFFSGLSRDFYFSGEVGDDDADVRYAGRIVGTCELTVAAVVKPIQRAAEVQVRGKMDCFGTILVLLVG